MSFRDRVDIEKLLEALDVKYERNGRKLVAKCPNPDHIDSSPSWSIVDAPGTADHGAHHCFACKFGGGPWELVIAIRGVDEEEAAEFVGALVSGVVRVPPSVPRVVIKTSSSERREYRLPPQVQIPSLDGSEWPAPFADYLARRGVTEEQLERWRIGYATRGPLRWRVVIPIHTRGRLVAHVARSIFADGSVRYDMPYGGAIGAIPEIALFGEPLLDPELPVLTIVEGSFSMLAIERAGAPNPIALLGSDWSPAKATILTSVAWEHVIVATDPDLAGERAARAIAASFRSTRVSRLPLVQSPDDYEQVALRALLEEALEDTSL